MAKNKKSNKKSGNLGMEDVPTSYGAYQGLNKNAARDWDQAYAKMESAAKKSGAQLIGKSSQSFYAQNNAKGSTFGTRVTISQPALIPVPGKKNTFTYGKVSGTKLNRIGTVDSASGKVTSAKNQGGGQRMNPKKNKKK